MGKLVMGYWDCPYCSTKHIEGTRRECPSCGKPRVRTPFSSEMDFTIKFGAFPI